ncbi:MAG: PAS domain S-box protein [Euryhalocaulis sp.]|uniref:two-component system sensor histidine kinase NtrB n=1 Tax=Euryhalocaulis sp. TaxID=2744307 RepID=UPI00184F66C0|nr:PAS domain-containing sensor histidine kinase [Euryhalocaulis sp.]MBA4800823.1 PAS domain S-box protein [Euryhalocaulis sp.]
MTRTYAQEQLQALVQTAVDGIMSIDRHGVVNLYNPACEKIFGWTEAEVLGQNVSMLMPSHYSGQHDRYIGRYLDTGEKRIIGIGREVEGLRKDGAVFPMDLSVGAFTHDGEPRFVGIVRDLTERVSAERRLRELQSQLIHMGRVSAMAEMGSSLAHELNQPLTAISLFLAAAERSLENDPDKAKGLFQRAQTEANRAGDIVRRIRQMVEQGDQEKSFISIREVIEAAVELCSVSEVDRSAEIDTSQADDAAEVFADETQIRQVMVNLIKNALDATQGQSERRIRVRTEIDDDFLSVIVDDNGPGIDAEIAARLFSPFVTSKPNGLGIGLSICRNIAEAHGGSLELAVTDGSDSLGGARFRLGLPVN